MAPQSFFELWSTAKHCLLVEQVSAGYWIMLAASVWHRNPAIAPEPTQAIGSTESAEATKIFRFAEKESEETRKLLMLTELCWCVCFMRPTQNTNFAIYLSVWRCGPRRKPTAYGLNGSCNLFIILWSKSVVGENCLHRTTQIQNKWIYTSMPWVGIELMTPVFYR